MSHITYKELLQKNKELDSNLSDIPYYNIQLLSNITVNQIAEPLEYQLRSTGIRAKVHIADYNNIVQQSAFSNQYNASIVFWEFLNLIENLHFNANNLTDSEVSDLLQKVKSEIDLTVAHLRSSSLVVWNRFSALVFNRSNIRSNRADAIVKELNAYLEANLPKGFFLIDIEKVLAETGIQNAIDEKFFISFKSLYSIAFYNNYAKHVMPVFKAANGKVKKVLVFDCDNTLWKGIIGEDGMQGIKMSRNEKAGVPFAEIQSLANYLNNEGVLVCLCSKNNFEDVERVFKEHPDMILNWEKITLKKVNWIDKETNLREIAKELNLGLDSLVFIDDSNFEVNLVRENVSAITVFQVPPNLYEYPRLFRTEVMPLFFNLSNTQEDKNKVKQYAEEHSRKEAEKDFRSFEDYLKSLNLEATLYINPKDQVARISQMTQKTNQFNFTTKRYSEPDIEAFLESKDHLTVTFDVRDRFGDYGITGLYIVRQQSKEEWMIDTMLMSCRVIGRKVEYAVFEALANYLTKSGAKKILLTYIRTPKNSIVEKLAPEFGFITTDGFGDKTNYQLNVQEFKGYGLDYVKVGIQSL